MKETVDNTHKGQCYDCSKTETSWLWDVAVSEKGDAQNAPVDSSLVYRCCFQNDSLPCSYTDTTTKQEAK